MSSQTNHRLHMPTKTLSRVKESEEAITDVYVNSQKRRALLNGHVNFNVHVTPQPTDNDVKHWMRSQPALFRDNHYY